MRRPSRPWTANFYFGQNREGQIIFRATPKELFVGTNRESTSEFLPIVANRLVSLIPRLRNLLIRRLRLERTNAVRRVPAKSPGPGLRPRVACGHESRSIIRGLQALIASLDRRV